MNELPAINGKIIKTISVISGRFGVVEAVHIAFTDESVLFIEQDQSQYYPKYQPDGLRIRLERRGDSFLANPDASETPTD